MRWYDRALGLEGIDNDIATASAAAQADHKEILRQDGLLEYAADKGWLEDGAREGLLSIGKELDANLPGNSAQRFFRSVSQGPNNEESRDYEETHRERILRASHLAYGLQGLGENLIDTHLDFMLGDSLKPTAKKLESGKPNTALQDALDEIWEDPRNDLIDDHDDLVKTLLIEGELFQPATISTIDGHIETGWLDPLKVAAVVQDDRGRDAFVKIKPKHGGGDPTILFILDSLNDQIMLEPDETGEKVIVTERTTNAEGVEMVTKRQVVNGVCFAWFWNRPKGGMRGRGELTPVLDHIDAYDEMIWSTVDVQNIKRLFLAHVKSPSIKFPSEGREFLKQIGLLTVPRNPKTFATNDKVEINLLSPPKAESERWLVTELGTSIMGAKGFPENWRGSQGNTNLAGAKASEFLPLRRLRRKQRRIKKLFKRRIDVELELKRRAGVVIPEGEYELVTMDVGGKDKQRQAEVLNTTSKALTQAASSGDTIRPELVNAAIVQLLGEMGIEIPKGADTVPDELVVDPTDLEAQLRAIAGEKQRTDDGNQDEEDRDRADEKGGRAA